MRFIRGEVGEAGEGRSFAIIWDKDPGYCHLVSVFFGRRSWFLEFGRGAGYDW